MPTPSAIFKVPVEEFSSPTPYTAKKDSSLIEIYEKMKSESFRHVPIVDGDQKPIGIVTDRDVKLYLSLDKEQKLQAHHIMSSHPFVVQPDTTLDIVALEMSGRKIGSALVIDESGRLTGIFTATDALNALVEILRGSIDNFGN